MSIRKAYNLVRQQVAKSERLTFSEFAILCRLDGEDGMRTSDIADYQNVLRPTMTHRTKHLSDMGLIERVQGAEDRRNIKCSITGKGRERVAELCESTRASIGPNDPLNRTTAERVKIYVSTMGAVSCDASELILLSIRVSEKGSYTVSELVNSLGLLQPTVSMSVASLKDAGLVSRKGSGRHGFWISLTDAGRDAADDTIARIEGLVVRRRRRAAKRATAR